MQPLMTGMGVTQLKRQPPQHFEVNGAQYSIRKNAEDPSVLFQHERVIPMHRFKVQVQKDVFAYGVMGILAPTPGTMEKPLDVVYIGFHNMDFDPMALGPKDIHCMHIYGRDSGSFQDAFVSAFLNPTKMVSQEHVERPPVTPYIVSEVTNGTASREPEQSAAQANARTETSKQE